MVFPPGPLPPFRSHRSWQALGTRIAAARAARGWSIPQLADAAGVKGKSVAKWELGIHRPQPQTLRRVADLLGMSSAELAALAGYPVDTT
jgi:transcriptional regulator with XRE-family HTH domain